MSGKITVKDRVLAALEAQKGADVSGEALAENLGVSRAAVWKAIKALQGDGYPISAATNRGYTLSPESDLLSEQGIRPYLSPEASDIACIQVYNLLESTNQTAKQLAMNDAPHGTVVLADSQTAGRGRLGRSFFSPTGSGIYMSLIIKPDFDLSKSVLITTAASVAVSRAVKKVCGAECEIKWVNDIYIDEKKICGILTEAVTDFESGHIESIILGIGINCREPEGGFPQELRGIAGIVPGLSSKNALAAQVINEVTGIVPHIETREFIKEYRERSMVTGREIRVFKGGMHSGGVDASALNIDEDGGLIVQYEDGSRETLSTGEISVRLS